MTHSPRSCSLLPNVLALAFAAAIGVGGMQAQDTDPRLQNLEQENRRLAERLEAQQKTIDALNAKMAELARTSEQQERTLREIEERTTAAAPEPSMSDREHEVRVGGEVGIALFGGGSDSQFPKSEFRVDDAIVTLEAPVWKDTFFYGEMKLLTRESSDDAFELGELYVDFENVSGQWGRPDLLSVRAGRINTPFGEENQVRGPVRNPLISHSLSDIWGTDEGVEIYGTAGAFQYVLAAQNGGISRLRDFNADKAFVGRLTWHAAPWLKLSASAMRTGELAASNDGLSDLWFATGFFRSIGSAETTAFWADLGEVDVVARWRTGQATAAFGVARYDDNDRLADNHRRLNYGCLELVQTIADRLYGAVRYSGIDAPGGYPLVGGGTPGEYFFRPSWTETLRRVSLGFGYRFSEPLVLKLEYSWNTGHMRSGAAREHEEFFGSEVGMRF